MCSWWSLPGPVPLVLLVLVVLAHAHLMVCSDQSRVLFTVTVCSEWLRSLCSFLQT
jgi:hypothetical protein